MTALLRCTLTCLLAFTLSACATTLRVDSEPEGATVLWSPDGTGDWRPWPPRAWGSEPDEPYTTPFRSRGSYGDTVWITVEKDGYYRPLPKAVQLYSTRREAVEFELAETPAAYAARMQQSGFVLHRGEWVDPVEEGLEEVGGVWLGAEDAFAMRQRAQGLVEFEGEWLTPAEREERYAERQRARGLVEFKGRWVSPAARAEEQEIDRQVRELAQDETAPLPLEPPRVVGRIDASDAQIQLVNSTSVPVRFLFSGPMSRSVVVAPYGTESTIILPPGRYSMAVVPLPVTLPVGQFTTPAVPEIVRREAMMQPYYLEHPVAEGFKYILGFDAGGRLDIGDLQEYQMQEPELPIEIPEIEIPEIQLPEREQPQRRRPPGGAGGGAPRAN